MLIGHGFGRDVINTYSASRRIPTEHLRGHDHRGVRRYCPIVRTKLPKTDLAIAQTIANLVRASRFPLHYAPIVNERSDPMNQPKMTRHARQRLQQRGSRAKDVAIVMAYGDIEVPARDGCRFLRLSRVAVAWLLEYGRIQIQEIDRARRLTVLADPLDRVVTVLKCDPDRRVRGPSRLWGRR